MVSSLDRWRSIAAVTAAVMALPGQRVKTPTAAAEFLLNLACEELDRLRTLTSDILRVANECISGAREQLAYSLVDPPPRIITTQSQLSPSDAMRSSAAITDDAAFSPCIIASLPTFFVLPTNAFLEPVNSLHTSAVSFR